MCSDTLKNAMNMSFCYEHVTSGYDLVVMIVASQATCSGSNPGIRITKSTNKGVEYEKWHRQLK